MNDKDINNNNELERLQNELFGAIDLDGESGIGGDRITNTAVATYSPSGPDAMFDLDFWDFDTQSNTRN
jgi:hypothetical protein